MAIREVFLSSTVRDLEAYRERVQLELQASVQIYASRGEQWTGGYDATVQRCHDKFDQSDCYLGIFAHWYGSMPPGRDISITHQEFRWAKERWGDRDQPFLAVFVPRRASDADVALQEEADRLVAEAGISAEEHRRRVEAFRNEYLSPEGEWRAVNHFGGIDDLWKQSIVTCATWRGQLMERARQGRRAARRVTDGELGSLGRGDQIEALGDLLSLLEAAPGVRALCCLVHGAEDAGQGELCEYLRQGELKSFGGRLASSGRPHQPHFDAAQLCAWFDETLRLGAGDSGHDPVVLAGLIPRAARRRPLVVIVNGIQQFTGGVEAFWETFWKPFAARMNAAGADRASGHPFVLVLASYRRETALSAGIARQASDDLNELDAAKLHVLLELTPFSKTDILRWFRELEVADMPRGRRAELAKLVLAEGDGVGGDGDGTPCRVFDRLRREVLWPDED